MTWPIGRGRDFAGTYDLATGEMRLARRRTETVERQPRRSPRPGARRIPCWMPRRVSDELALWEDACGTFDFNSFREGHLTPVFFGSALKNFGVKRSARCACVVRAGSARAGFQHAYRGRSRETP